MRQPTTSIALLRGINVGGKRRVEMARLAEVFKAAGMTDVRTYINSGNVIFTHAPLPAPELRAVLEAAIEQAFGFPVRVIVRNAEEIRALLGELPDGWTDGPEAKCDVLFLGEEIDTPDVLEQVTIKPEIDDVRYVPGALLWRVERSRVTRSGLMRLAGTELYASMTVRNCNTLRKLGALVEDSER